jgi:hypothetical protein
MKAILFSALFWIILTGCNNPEYALEEVDNPQFKSNVEFLGYENLNYPGSSSSKRNTSWIPYSVGRQMSLKGF